MSVHRLAVRLRGRGFGTGLGGAGAGSAASSVAFENVLTNGTLVSQIGPTLTSTRATTSYTQDFEGLLKPILVNEARFHKLRRVENLVAQSEVVGGTGWLNAAGFGNHNPVTITANDRAAPTGPQTADLITFGGASSSIAPVRVSATTGRSFAFSAYVYGGTAGVIIDIYRGTAGVLDTTVTSVNLGVPAATWQRVSIVGTQTGTSTQLEFTVRSNSGSGTTVWLWGAQVEETTGQANQNPSEYVSNGVLSSPWHGAGVDGVRYFAVTNPWTVASNVATEGASTPLTLTAAGLSVFGAATNLLLHNRDLTNAAWTKGATATVAKNQTGADGLTNGASSFTAGATLATNTVMQAVVSASAARYPTAYVKRLVGTGTVEMTTDGGTTWVNVTSQISTSYAKVSIPVQTVTNPSTGFRITTNADSIAVDFVMQTTVADAPAIETTTADVTVNADSITAAHDGGTEGTLYVRAIGPVSSDVSYFGLDNGTTAERVLLGVSANANFVLVTDGAVQQAFVTQATRTVGGTERPAGRYKLNDTNVARNGTAATADTICTTPTTTFIRLGDAGGTVSDTVIQAVQRQSRGLSDAELVTLSSTGP